MDRYDTLIAFYERLLGFSEVERVVTHPDGRFENDAEHTWHMLCGVLLFCDGLDLDVRRCYELALIHDLPELLVGDVSAFDESARVGKHERELLAARELFCSLPVDVEERFLALYAEYEAQETPESRFVRAIDKLQPLVVNLRSKGADFMREKITYERMDALKRPLMTDSVSLAVYERLLSLSKPYFYVE